MRKGMKQSVIIEEKGLTPSADENLFLKSHLTSLA